MTKRALETPDHEIWWSNYWPKKKKNSSPTLQITVFFPLDVIGIIISWLDVYTFFNARYVCRKWQTLIDNSLSRLNSFMDRGIYHMCCKFLKREQIITIPLLSANRLCRCGLEMYQVHGLHKWWDAACHRPRCMLKRIFMYYFKMCDCGFTGCKMKNHFKDRMPALQGWKEGE